MKALKDLGFQGCCEGRYGSATTYKGTEEIYNSKNWLPTTVFDRSNPLIKGLIESVMEDASSEILCCEGHKLYQHRRILKDTINSIVESIYRYRAIANRLLSKNMISQFTIRIYMMVLSNPPMNLYRSRIIELRTLSFAYFCYNTQKEGRIFMYILHYRKVKFHNFHI